MHSNFTWQKIQKSFIQTCGYRSKSVTNQFTGVDVWTGTVKQSARAPVHRAIKAHNKINTQLQGRVFVHIKPKKYPNLDSSSYFISLTSYLSVRTSILSNGINHKSFIVLYIILILMGSMNFWTVFFFSVLKLPSSHESSVSFVGLMGVVTVLLNGPIRDGGARRKARISVRVVIGQICLNLLKVHVIKTLIDMSACFGTLTASWGEVFLKSYTGNSFYVNTATINYVAEQPVAGHNHGIGKVIKFLTVNRNS